MGILRSVLSFLDIYDYIFIFAILFFFAATSCVIKISGKDFCPDNENAVLKDAYYRKKVWIHSSIIWLAIHYFVVLSTFLSTSIVIYISMADGRDGKLLFYSIVSFFSSIITYVVNPYKISFAYREAYRLLDAALLDNENIKEAIKQGEKIIYKGHK